MQAPLLVCGLGQVGYHVVSLLLKLGEPVTVVTLGARADWIADAEGRGARVIMGDARSAAVMAEAGIADVRAVISCSDDDLTNIEIAIDSKRLRPDLPVVIRVFDQGLAKSVESSLGVESAVAMATIAAPAFAGAAVGEHMAVSFELEGRRFSTSLHDLAGSWVRGKTPAQLEGERGISVLAHMHPERGIEAPGWDTVLEGSSALVFGPVEALLDLGATSFPAGGFRFYRPWGVLGFMRRLWAGASPELRTVFIALNVLVLIGVVIFWLGMSLSFMDAVYFVVTTVTTTGYGDITPRNAPTSIKLFGILLMLVGSAMIATLYSIITDFIVHARLQQLVGKQRVPDRGHVVVAGLGNLGFRIVQNLLRRGMRVAVIERDAGGRFVETIRPQAPVVIGDARDPETLLRAGVAQSSAVVAVTADDSVNLSVGLAVAEITPKAKRIIRLFDADLAAKVKETFRFNEAVSASTIAAPSFVAAALYGKSLAAFVHEGRFFALTIGEAKETAEGENLATANVRVGGKQCTVTVHSRTLAASAIAP